MRIIKLFCSGGMSTSFLAARMQEEAQRRGLNYQISADGISSIDKEGIDTDLILLARKSLIC